MNFPHRYQLNNNNCGPTCLQIIAKYYGKKVGQNFLAKRCNVTINGCSIEDLCKGAESIGLKAGSYLCDLNTLEEHIKLPIIVHLSSNHYVVIYKIDKAKYFISDPKSGKYCLNKTEFANLWKKYEKNGYLITIEPTITFNEFEFNKVNTIKAFNFIMQYLYSYKKEITKLLFTILIVIIIQTILPFISKTVIDVGIKTVNLSLIKTLLIASILLVICSSGANWIRNALVLHISNRIKISILSDFLHKLLKLPYTFFENSQVGDVLQRIRDQERIQTFIMNFLLEFIISTLLLIVFGIILYVFSSTLFWIFLAGSLTYILWVAMFLVQRKKLDVKYFSLMAENNSTLINIFQGILDIKGYQIEKDSRWNWENTQVGLYKVNIKILNLTQLQDFGAGLIDNLKNIGLTFFSAYSVINGEMSLGMLVSTQYIIGNLNSPLNKLIGVINNAQLAYISFIRLNDIFQLEEDSSSDHLEFFPKHKSISFKNVSYRYQGAKNYTLKNINFFIQEGKKIAIVGNSGSGKSTIVKLVLNLYKYYSGEILIGTSNINSISYSQIRKRMGFVMQESKLLKGSIIYNITLSNDDFDEDKLIKAVEVAFIRKEIESFNEGYQTIIGEGGIGLSTGQKQRILIARAIYSKPEYLIFDEATNALDSNLENSIFEKIDEYLPNTTKIIVSHRLQPIINSDYIIVLRNGEIVEVGNNNTLIENKKDYYKIFKNQIFTQGHEQSNIIK